MILYTEKQLMEAYKEYCKKLPKAPKEVAVHMIISLEEFRTIYEDEMEEYYHGSGSDN